MMRKVQLDNVQVGSHGELTAKILDNDGEEAREFITMHGEMNHHFNNDQMASIVPHHPQPGQVCVGKVGTVWHRVRVQVNLSMRCGVYASCFLVDEGKKAQIPVPCLRQIPTRFSKIPHQIKHLELDGIKPLSLQISPEDLMVYERSVTRWDSSAVSFINEYIKAASTVKAKIMSHNADGVISVKMYLYTRNNDRFCLNDLLIDKRYAVPLDYEDTPTLAIQKSRDTSDGSSSLQRLKMSNLILNQRDNTAKSDIEQNEHSGQVRHRECVTDTEAVSSLSHRFLPKYTRNSAINEIKPSDSGLPTMQTMPSSHEKYAQSNQSNRSAYSDKEHNVAVFHRTPSNCSLDQAAVTRSSMKSDNMTFSSVEGQGSVSADERYISNSIDRSVKSNTTSAVGGSVSPVQCIGRGSLIVRGSLAPQTSPVQSVGRRSPGCGRGILLKTFSPKSPDRTQGQSVLDSNQSNNYTSDRDIETDSSSIFTVNSNISARPMNTQDTRSKLDKPGGLSLLEKFSLAKDSESRPRNYESGNESSASCVSAVTASVMGNVAAFRKSQRPKIAGGLVNREQDVSYESGNESSASCVSAVTASVMGNVAAFRKSQRPKIAGGYVNREQDISNYESGNESSASCVSAVTASVMGNVAAFRKSQRPKIAGGSINREQDVSSSTETSSTQAKHNLQQKIKSPAKSPTKTEMRDQSQSSDTDSSMAMLHKKVLEAREKASASFSSKSERVNRSVKENIRPQSSAESAIDKKSEIIGKFSGEKLLKELSSNVPVTSQSTANNDIVAVKPKSESAGMFGRTDNVVVHGKALNKPVYHIERLSFIQDVFKHWENSRFASPTLVQSYGWPSVRSGRHITAISPPSKGKSLTYLYVLITYLSSSNMYRELPRGMGPLVIILSKSYRRAENVYHTACQIVNRQKHRVILVYGGGHEENRAFELFNGCDIMVTTPPCLMRLLKKGYTDLRRLCHLVIDDSDHTLDTFHVEINYIKSEYSLVIQNESKQLECPRQILVFGSQWNEVTSQFIENVLNEPILIITSPFEAAIYGRVRQNVDKQLECPRQILVFGSQWNEVTSQFIENILNEPILIITSPFEAAIYGRVRQNENKQLEYVRQILVFGSQWNEVTSQFIENVLNEPILIITSPFEAAIYGRVRQLTLATKSEYSLVIQNESKQLECPRQILVFGSQWNEVTSQFIENVLNEPILIITSPFEAAIYGRVRQIAHLCKSKGRMNELVGLLENIVETQHKIIIFSSSKEDMHFLVEGLRAYSYNLIYVSEYMELYDVQRMAEDWNRGARLLVCCDTHVMDMNISDASVVIHYDLPNSKTKFGNRMSCMRKHFYNFAKSSKKKTLEPVSHLLITENCGQQVKTIQELLKRSKAEFPKELKAFIAGMVEQREQDDNKELCYQLLAYGTCRDKWKCGRRHIVIPQIDTSPETEWLPTEGQVKVLVTHVNDSDASHFYVRLLEVKDVDGSVSQPSLMYVQLMIDLECWFRKVENQTKHTAPYTGELCGYQDRGVFYRVQILDIPNMNTHGKGSGSIEVKVKFVDIGKDMDIDLNKLYVLPMQLKEVPFQAVEVFVCKVKPVDKDPEWTIKASIFINELLYGKELEGKIVLKLGGILWLDPLVERVYLGETRALVNRAYVNNELIRNGFANENPTHLEKLYKLCEGRVKLPRLLLVKTKMSQILQTDALPLCKKYHDIHVSSVTSPDLFFVQRREKQKELDEVMEGIAQYIHDLEYDDGIKDMEVGQFCLAQYESFDQRWYRARVMEVLEDSYEIFFADFGDLDTVPKDKVKEFPADKFFDLPLQAIECKLHGVCTDKTLEQVSGDALWDLSHFVNGDFKCLVTEIKSQEPAEFNGRHRFVIEIFDTNGSPDLNIAQELVHRQLVHKLEDSGIEDLFPQPVGLRRKIYTVPLEKVVDMAAILFWEHDSTKACEIAKQILDLIKNSVSRSTESLHPSRISALHCLIKLTSHVDFSIEVVIEDCILELINTGERMSGALLQSVCLSNVVRCLEMDSNSSMQCQAAEFLSNLCSASSKIRNYIQGRESNILSTLIELFEFTQSEKIKGSICKVFAVLCTGTDSVFPTLMEKSVCSRLKTLLQESSNHEVQEAVILLLSALSDHDRSHNDLKKESLIEALVKNLSSTTCDKCIQHSVEFCDVYASTRRKHKTHLLELEMVPLLNRIIELDIQPTTVQLCKDLMSSLVVKFPSEPAAGVKYMGDRNTEITDNEKSPEVHWCQTTFVIQLTVKIAECANNKDLFVFTEHTVKFRETVKGVRYSFHLDLFDKIVPSMCKVAVKSREILVSLYKQTKGRWTKLTKGKKPSWIFVDYERFEDSSMDSDSYDESRPFVVKKKRKKKKLPTDRSTESACRIISSASDSDSLDNFEDPCDRDEFNIFD